LILTKIFDFLELFATFTSSLEIENSILFTSYTFGIIRSNAINARIMTFPANFIFTIIEITLFTLTFTVSFLFYELSMSYAVITALQATIFVYIKTTITGIMALTTDSLNFNRISHLTNTLIFVGLIFVRLTWTALIFISTKTCQTILMTGVALWL
jgi:hypothetical protein